MGDNRTHLPGVYAIFSSNPIWSTYLVNVDQNVNTTASPTFVTVTATTLNVATLNTTNHTTTNHTTTNLTATTSTTDTLNVDTINEKTSANGVTIDSLLIKDGFYENKFVCSIYHGATQAVNNNVTTQASLGSVEADSSDSMAMSATGSTITIVKSGFYYIRAFCRIDGIRTTYVYTDRISIQIYVNGGISTLVGNVVSDTAEISRVVYLNANDTLTCYYYQVTGATRNFGHASQSEIQTRLTAILIGT